MDPYSKYKVSWFRLIFFVAFVFFMCFGVTLSLSAQKADLLPNPSWDLLDVQTQTPYTWRLREPAYSGQVLIFLNLTCPCARNARQMLQEQIPILKKLGYRVSIINTDKTTPLPGKQALFARMELPAPVLDDSQWELVREFSIRTASEWVLLSPQGEKIFAGAIYSEDLDYLVDITEDLVNGWPLRYARGPGLGCSLIDPEGEHESQVWIE